tara:strand:- start:1774 stop:2277 length:504 start_codon:yes stop_codon:yes gene_type:complete
VEHKNKDIKVTKDFLSKHEFDNIFGLISGSDFSWFYQQEQNPNSKDGFFFSHKIYDNDHSNSNHFNRIMNPLKMRIQYTSLIRAQINLLTRSDKPRRSIMHRDFNNDTITTGLFYLNDNNGYTEFESGEKIKSISNMYVEFPVKLKHRAVSQTDIDCRAVLNLNYLK